MLTDEQLNLLTEEERAAWERCEKAMKAQFGVSEQGRAGVLWSLFTDYPMCPETRIASFAGADDAMFYKEATTDIPAAMETIAALREQLAGAERERDEARRYALGLENSYQDCRANLEDAIRDRKGFEADACRYAAELTNARIERDKAEHERDCNIVERDIIRGEVLAEVYDRLLRHADSYTARDTGGWYHALRHAADIVKGMVSE